MINGENLGGNFQFLFWYFEVCSWCHIYLFDKQPCVFSFMYNNPRTIIMRIYESHFGTFLLRRSQEIAANRDANNILAEYLLDWQDPAISRRNIIMLVRPLFRLGNSSNTFDVSSPVYLPRDREFPSCRGFPFISVSSLIPSGNAQCSLNAFSSFHRVQTPSINFFIFIFIWFVQTLGCLALMAFHSSFITDIFVFLCNEEAFFSCVSFILQNFNF